MGEKRVLFLIGACLLIHVEGGLGLGNHQPTLKLVGLKVYVGAPYLPSPGIGPH